MNKDKEDNDERKRMNRDLILAKRRARYSLMSSTKKAELMKKKKCYWVDRKSSDRCGAFGPIMIKLLKQQIAMYNYCTTQNKKKLLTIQIDKDGLDKKSTDSKLEDYSCEFCHKELSNYYFQCNGCKVLLNDNFNICFDCYCTDIFKVFKIINVDMPNKLTSNMHHMGKKHNNTSHAAKQICVVCKKCYCCKCNCHHAFTLRYQFYGIDKLRQMLKSVKSKLQQL